MKKCIKCNKDKALSDFNFRKDINNHRSECKECIKTKNKKYRENNIEKIRKIKKQYSIKNKDSKREYDKNRYKKLSEEEMELVLEKRKIYYYKNKEKIKNRVRDFVKENPDKVKEYKKKSREKNRKIRNEKEMSRKQNDELYKLTHDIRNLILSSFKKSNHNKLSKTTDILGCSIEEFKRHIEVLFEQWMTWKNHGKYNNKKRTWHIDHIIPVSSARDRAELIKLNHYTNLRPLCSLENLKKSNNILKNG